MLQPNDISILESLGIVLSQYLLNSILTKIIFIYYEIIWENYLKLLPFYISIGTQFISYHEIFSPTSRGFKALKIE